MCEIVGVAFPDPRRLADVHGWVTTLEAFGLGGFGWGVAYLSDARKVEVERGLGRYAEEVTGRQDLLDIRSTRWLVHLRRPNKLSTIEYADTQPFYREGEFAFCHNGFFDRADSLRLQYDGRLLGCADSEVGWCFFTDRLDEGAPVRDAMRQVDETFQGKVNLGYLDRSGRLAFYTHNPANAMWQFNVGDAQVVSTSLHSDDDSVFRLVYPESTNRRLLPTGTAVVVTDADDPLG